MASEYLNKKPFYKRWLFWAIVVLVVLTVLGSVGAALTTKNKSEDIVGGVDVSTELASSSSSSSSES